MARWRELEAKSAHAGEFVALAFDRCHHMVFALAHRVTGSGWDAEDITQSVFEAFARKLGSIRDPAGIPNYLKTSVIRAAVAHVKRGQWIQERERMMEEPAPPVHPKRGAVSGASVRRVLMRLAPEERAALVLKHVEGHTQEEVARLMRTSLSTARRRLASARLRMVAMIGEQSTSRLLRTIRNGA